MRPTAAKKPSFFWLTPAALKHLRAEWQDPPSALVGQAVYVALVEIGNAKRARTKIGVNSEPFEASRGQIAAKAGHIDRRSVDAALPVLERIGLLNIEKRRQGKVNLPSLYTLIEPLGGGEPRSPGGESSSLGAGDLSSPPLAHSVRQGGERGSQGVANEVRPKEEEVVVQEVEEEEKDRSSSESRINSNPAFDRGAELLGNLESWRSELPAVKAGSTAEEKFRRAIADLEAQLGQHLVRTLAVAA